MVNILNPKLLDLHVCAGQASDFNDVEAVKTPQATEQWQPVSHDRLVKDFREAIGNTPNLDIVQEHHTLHRYGQRYFGLFQVKGIARKHDDEIGTIFGLRNSHDKAFAASVCAGDAPFVCSNLIFNNEIVIGRKHTVEISRDLPQLFSEALSRLLDSREDARKRVEALKAHELTDLAAHDFICRAARTDAIAPAHVGKVVEQWHDPEPAEAFSDRTLWSMQNAFSNVWRAAPLQTVRRSAALRPVIDAELVA